MKKVTLAPLFVFYAMFLAFAGFIGFHTAKSLVSLLVSSIMATLLITFAIIEAKKPGQILLFLLIGFFGYRFFTTWTLWPSFILFSSAIIVFLMTVGNIFKNRSISPN